MSDDRLGSSPIDPKERVGWLASNYWNTVCRDAYGLIGNWHDAQDIAQDTFVRVMKRLEDEPDLKVEAHRPWLRSFLRYAFLDFLRKKNKAAIYQFTEISLNTLETMRPTEWQKILEELIDNKNEQPDIAAESKEGIGEIKRDIIKLRKNMQKILYMKLFAGRTDKEIAEELGQPMGTVKSNISEGKKLLRIALEERMRGEG
jgi:RNA polymerase sigma factor (sigma-70 family)